MLQDFAGVLKRRGTFVERLLQIVVRVLEIFLGLAAVGHVLRHRHEMAHARRPGSEMAEKLFLHPHGACRRAARAASR